MINVIPMVTSCAKSVYIFMMNIQKLKKKTRIFLEEMTYQATLLPYRPRQLINHIWIRKDEFHHSLEMDIDFYSKLRPAEQAKYTADLVRRRNIAHRRSL